ncbi:MAG TPA: hypothetical protein QF753_10585 [Victivallales bacterium]|nr:hypothetical protein [Victivallales bacterium]
MNFKKKLLILSSTAIIFIAQNLLAGSDYQGLINNKITIQHVINLVQKAGYSYISSIAFDDGYWQVKTLKNKIETKYILNSKTSKFTKLGQDHENDKQPPENINVIQRSIKTVKNKYPKYKIKSISHESSSWNVNAFDETGMEYEMLVNGEGSKILFSKIDD